jgi:cell division protein FtsW (lipid II flippase)
MAVTYTAASQRDARRATVRARRLDLGDAVLAATSLVCLLAIGLAYQGQVRSNGIGDPSSTAPVNLSLVTSGAQLEPVLAGIYASVDDRRLAAGELVRFLVARREAGDPLSQVAAILAARLPVGSIERSRAVTYAERLQRARAAAADAGGAAPTSLPVVTSADLAAIKPRLTVRTAGAFAKVALVWALALVAAFHAVAFVWRLRGIDGDRVILAAAHLLTGLGFAVLLSRADPLRDTLLVVRYTHGVLVGLTLLGAISCIRVGSPSLARFSYLPLLAALSLSLLLILFGDGPGASGAKVNLGPVQPIEAIRLLLVLFLAGYFARRWELLRQIRGSVVRDRSLPRWLGLPRADYLLPVGAGVGAALLLFFLQKDLGPALFLSCLFLALYAVARGRWPMALGGALTVVGGFWLGYHLRVSSTLAERIEMWRSPWDNAVGGGDQVSQSIWALATGGLFGTGLGLGETRYLPAGHTDLILAAAGEELGLLGLLVIAAAYVVVAWRGFRSASRAGNDYGLFLATALTLFLVVPVLVMAAGLLGVMPLTGVVTPFLSYGGSAMAANFAALGMLVGLGGQRAAHAVVQDGAHADVRDVYDPFRTPMRYLRGALGVCGTALVLAVIDVQALRADALVVRPHLGLQADGVRRYQYNPRILDLTGELPRGSVYDRGGLVLATRDPAVAATAREAYRRAGVGVDASCVGSHADPHGEPNAVSAPSRCYPLGGEAFHLLGDATTRLNWAATNTSYVERDHEARLRGFDDHATTVPVTDARGRPALALRRDYRALVPLLRHRHDVGHPAVVEMRERRRDVHLTIDARLQHRVASIVAAHARRSASGKAAAVVLDPATGDVLALVSYPWPSAGAEAGSAAGSGAPRDAARRTAAHDALLDRARYGLYPPGSAFKLVTATAALRRDLATAQERFTCSGLPDGRVGVRIPGGRPVRDDVLDHRPHGTIDMQAGVVHSCNAYFAQLALKLGPEALLDTAARLGISVVSSNPTAARLRATLAQAGYGQGDVLTSPLRMARVASAIAAGGVLEEARLEREGPSRDERLLSPEAAELLGRYMREVVLEGTARALRDHPARIAGKTGTAEVAGAPSHSWFVGFAPHGAAARRVAFAVLLENGGYGGQAAARAAGEIVTAAAALGLVP